MKKQRLDIVFTTGPEGRCHAVFQSNSTWYQFLMVGVWNSGFSGRNEKILMAVRELGPSLLCFISTSVQMDTYNNMLEMWDFNAPRKQRWLSLTPVEGQHKDWKKSNLNFFARGGEEGLRRAVCSSLSLMPDTYKSQQLAQVRVPLRPHFLQTCKAAGVQRTLTVPPSLSLSSCCYFPLPKTGKVICSFFFGSGCCLLSVFGRPNRKISRIPDKSSPATALIWSGLKTDASKAWWGGGNKMKGKRAGRGCIL